MRCKQSENVLCTAMLTVSDLAARQPRGDVFSTHVLTMRGNTALDRSSIENAVQHGGVSPWTVFSRCSVDHDWETQGCVYPIDSLGIRAARLLA